MKLINNINIYRITLKITLTVILFCFPSARTASIDTKSQQAATVDIDTIEYRQATAEDVDDIVQLMQNAAADKDEIVILPKIFRARDTAKKVSEGRFFVATCSNNKTTCKNETYTSAPITAPSKHERTVIAFTKLFCINDENEQNQVLLQELHSDLAPEDVTRITIRKQVLDDKLRSDQLPSDKAHQAIFDGETIAPISAITGTTYIYKGADYTHPGYRHRRINHHLTTFAFNHILRAVQDHIYQHNNSHLALAYGLTKANAGDQALDGRTPSIVGQFMPFVHQICQKLEGASPTECILARYSAHMPMFDPEASECKPLPDHSKPGYGNILACKLR